MSESLAEKAAVIGIAGCIVTVIAVPMMIVDLALMGFVTMKVWNWFLPTLAAGIPTIGFAQAVGIRIVWNCFNRQAPKKENGPEPTSEQATKHLVTSLAWLFLSPLFLLGVAYAVKSFLF